MSEVYFTSDLHFGHKNIHKFREGFRDEFEHMEYVIEKWNEVVGKRDVVWVLGDICFKEWALPSLGRLRGNKFCCLGNHDMAAKHFEPYFQKVVGFTKYKGFWLSHAPVHPLELRGCNNIHGHVHKATLPDGRYFNACLENTDFRPIHIEEVRHHFKQAT